MMTERQRKETKRVGGKQSNTSAATKATFVNVYHVSLEADLTCPIDTGTSLITSGHVQMALLSSSHLQPSDSAFLPYTHKATLRLLLTPAPQMASTTQVSFMQSVPIRHTKVFSNFLCIVAL